MNLSTDGYIASLVFSCQKRLKIKEDNFADAFPVFYIKTYFQARLTKADAFKNNAFLFRDRDLLAH